MGVKACDRSGCSNIMCDQLIRVRDEQYYICWECQRELTDVLKTWPIGMSRADFEDHVYDFMHTRPRDNVIKTAEDHLEDLYKEEGY